MRILSIITLGLLIAWAGAGCTMDEEPYSLEYIPPPSSLTVTFDITHDNSGLVTFYPNAEGAVKFRITFGDAADEAPVEFSLRQPITHTYAEGSYLVKVEAVGITGLTSEIEQSLNVSYTPPENLVILVENDPAISRQVNISATADFATLIEFHFGDLADEEPVITLPGVVVSHQYEVAGEYEITVVAKGGSQATLDSTFAFTVTENNDPLESAPEPPARINADVISIFSDSYEDVADTDFNPDWGQATIVSTPEIDGNPTLKYANLNYQGTQFGSTVDASSMEFLHIDMWTVDASQVSVYPISLASGEKSVALPVVSGEWKAYDIPLTAFTDQGLIMADIHQFKFVGSEGSTIFLDNLYFYRESGAQVTPILPLDFESSTILYNWNNFDGGEVTVLDNPESSGINITSRVARMVKNAGQTWGGSWIALEGPMDFTSRKTMKMKVFAPRTGAKVLLKVEHNTNAGIFFEAETQTTVANQWEELTFDFGTISDSELYQKIVIIFDNGTMGDGSPDFTFLFDDIEQSNE
jgi:hypothetical protein